MLKKFFIVALVAAGALLWFSPSAASPSLNYYIKEYGAQIVKLRGKGGGGTGFAVKAPSGNVYTMTNKHVCKLSADGTLQAELPGSQELLDLRIIKKAENTDLCLLEGVPNKRGLEVAKFFSQSLIITALGHPALKPLTPSQGIAIGRDITEIWDDETTIEECTGGNKHVGKIRTWFGEAEVCLMATEGYYTTLKVSPGSSGSPVLNNWGQVVGVIFALGNRTYDGIMIPLDEVQKFLSVF